MINTRPARADTQPMQILSLLLQQYVCYRESIQDVFHNFDSVSAAICSVAFCSSTGNLSKPGTCVAVCRDQRHWAARLSHKVPCKFVLCSPRTHNRRCAWLHGDTSLYSSAHISHKSGTGIHGKPCADFHVLYDQTQKVANFSSMLCIAARQWCMWCTCTPPLDSWGVVSRFQCSVAHT